MVTHSRTVTSSGTAGHSDPCSICRFAGREWLLLPRVESLVEENEKLRATIRRPDRRHPLYE